MPRSQRQTSTRPAPETEQKPSKSELKRQMHTRRQIIEKAVRFSPQKIKQWLGDTHLAEQLVEAGRLQKSAYKRQIGYLNKIADDAEVSLLASHLSEIEKGHSESVGHIHQIEKWRQQLIQGDLDLMQFLVTEYGADRQKLRHHVQSAQKEIAAPAEDTAVRTVAYKKLFQFLKSLVGDYDNGRSVQEP
ncbi:MAG: ribosome biogenesis factor YjgA [Pseudomonadota bacterium]